MSFTNLYNYYQCKGEHSKKSAEMQNYLKTKGTQMAA